jgi:hypothetical protein
LDKRKARRKGSIGANLSEDLKDNGDVLLAQGELAEARELYEESLGMARRLAAVDTSNAGLQRDMAVSLVSLAAIPSSGATWADVRAQLEDMDHKRDALACRSSPAGRRQGARCSGRRQMTCALVQ